jgi:protein-tyrosine-phosphatase
MLQKSGGKQCYLGIGWGKEIPDPYRQSDEAFKFVYQLIEQACDSWVKIGG